MAFSFLGRWSQFLVLTALVTGNSAIFYAQNEGNDFPRIGRRSSLPDHRYASENPAPKRGLDLAGVHSGSADDAESLATKLGEDYLTSVAALKGFSLPTADGAMSSLRTAYRGLLAELGEKEVQSGDGLARTKWSTRAGASGSRPRFGLASFAMAARTRNANSGGQPTAVIPRRQYGVFGDLSSSPAATSSN